MAAKNPPQAPEQRQATTDGALLEQHMRSLSQVRDPALRFLAEELLAQLKAIHHTHAAEVRHPDTNSGR